MQPRFQADVVAVAGGDVRDDEADGPDMIDGATQGQRELVFRDRATPPGPRGAELLDADLDPANGRVSAFGPAGRGVVAGRDRPAGQAQPRASHQSVSGLRFAAIAKSHPAVTAVCASVASK